MAKERNMTLTDRYRLYSHLQRCGLSFLGAQQLLSGQIVTSPRDRRVIASIISNVSPRELERVRFTPTSAVQALL
jgi:hypothetical protein